MAFKSFDELRAACQNLPAGSDSAAAAVARRQDTLTKPQGSLGRLETIAAWLARWQGRDMPRLDHVQVVVFAGSHGVTAQGVSAFPAEVTHQMVANFSAGGAAINQLARAAGAELSVVPLEVERPTGDFTQEAGDGRGRFPRRRLSRLRLGRQGHRPDLLRRNGHRQHHDGGGPCRGAVRRRHGRLGRSRHRRRRRRPRAQGLGHRPWPGAPQGRARRPAEDCRRARRPRACRDHGRDARRPPPERAGAARRFRLHRGDGAAAEARPDRPRPRAGRPCLGRSQAIAIS